MSIKKGDKVTVKFTGKLENGQIFITTDHEGPLTFIVGKYDMIKGFEDGVIGMNEGDSKNITLSPDKAFGNRDQQLIVKLPLDSLPKEIIVGAQLKDNESENIWTVKEVNEEKKEALLDGNHMLAGHTLTFDVEIVCVETTDQ